MLIWERDREHIPLKAMLRSLPSDLDKGGG